MNKIVLNFKDLFPMFLIFLIMISAGCGEKTEEREKWYKGNLHTHSYWSDGDEFPEMIMKWYKNGGYHFVALSDHNILAQGEKWKTIPEEEILMEGFEKYLEEYGEDWVEYRQEPSGLEVLLKTYDEYTPLFEEKGKFLIIRSEEITTGFEDKPVHLNATNIQELIIPHEGNSVSEVLQNNIDAVLQQREETGEPIMPHINHPNFHYGISAEDMIKLTGERFFEVYNGHPAVNNFGDSTHMGTEDMWDLINIAYFDRGQPLMYGIATDDSHNYHQFGSKFSNAGRGWVMVRADSLEAGSLIEAMEDGRFYSSTGVELENISIIDNSLEVKVKTEPGVNYRIEFIGAYTDKAGSEVLMTEAAGNAVFKVTEDLRFVRAKVISDMQKKNPFEEGEFEVAWTQPVTHQ